MILSAGSIGCGSLFAQGFGSAPNPGYGLEETATFPRGWRELPQIKSYRPKMTFFDGLKSEADVRPANVSLKPTIAVISTVRLYYQSPATKTPSPAK